MSELEPSRFDYIAYDRQAQSEQAGAKQICSLLETTINALGKGRYQSLALTKLEETYMYIGKAIRDNQIARNGNAPLLEERGNS